MIVRNVKDTFAVFNEDDSFKAFSIFTDIEQMLNVDIAKMENRNFLLIFWAYSTRERTQSETSQETVEKDTQKRS